MSESSFTPTPILDRQAPLPAPARARTEAGVGSVVVISLVWAGLIVAVQFLDLPFVFGAWVRAAVDFLFGPWSIVSFVVAVTSVLAAILAAIAVHELGHLVGGLAVGFQYHSVRIGPFQFDTRFALTLDRKVASLFTGMVFIVPVTTQDLARRGLAMVAAGPLANILAGCLVYALPFAKGIFWSVFIVLSIGTGLTELFPFRSAIGWSDGKVLFNLLSRRAWSERWLALMKLRVDFSNGTPPENLSPDFVEKVVAIRDSSVETVASHSLAYAGAIQRNDLDRAAQMLEVCLAHVDVATAEVREALISDAATFHAEKRRNPELARQWLESLRSTSAQWLVLRVEASILEAEGNIEGAIAKVKECEAAANALPEGPQRTWLLGMLQQWQARLSPVQPG